MGEVKTLLITGATGFLGRAVVACALARGHKVRALVRHAGTAPGGDEVVVADLADGLPQAAARGVDAVIHCAARLSGDDAAQARDTLGATRAVCAAGLPMVLAGSMAVYPGRPGLIDETTPIEPAPEARDAYARAKLAQEAILRAANKPARLLRIGALYAPGRVWNAHLGLRFGPVLLRLAGGGELPLVSLADAARALVIAAERPFAPGIEVINIVGDDRPDARAWLRRMAPGERPRLTLPLPWPMLLPLAHIARALRLPVPGLLRPATLRYRFAPRRYDNARARAALGWQPEAGV